LKRDVVGGERKITAQILRSDLRSIGSPCRDQGIAPHSMDRSTMSVMRVWRGWFAWALVAGIAYSMIGVGFAPLTTPSVLFWRRAAWAVSAMIYAAHIGLEHFKLGNSPRSAALHVAFGAGLGGFGLAMGATVHSLLAGAGNPQLLRISLLVWPLITGIPAYMIALVLTAVLARLPGYHHGL
jgi:hypothetical protein